MLVEILLSLISARFTKSMSNPIIPIYIRIVFGLFWLGLSLANPRYIPEQPAAGLLLIQHPRYFYPRDRLQYLLTHTISYDRPSIPLPFLDILSERRTGVILYTCLCVCITIVIS